MKTFSLLYRRSSIILSAALFIVFIPGSTQASEYKWLKTNKYEKLFVYTDFSECGAIADRLNESVKRILLHSDIKPTISNSLVFQTINIGGKSAREVLDDELTSDHKIIMYITGNCVAYNSVYIYQFDIHFGIIDNKISEALLYSSPRESVMGADTISGMDRKFRKIMEDAVADYLSANAAKPK